MSSQKKHIQHPRRRLGLPSQQRHRRTLCSSLFFLTAGLLVGTSEAFAPSPRILAPYSTTGFFSSLSSCSSTRLFGYNSHNKNSVSTGRRRSPQQSSASYPRAGGAAERTKRQERVGHLVQTELSQILHSGLIKGYDVEFLDDELRQRISVVQSDVSPDLRQARISVSIRAARSRNSSDADAQSASSSSAAVDRRRAYAWLVRHTKQIRHTLAQRLSHMKTCPTLTFQQVDVSAAVDVMYLIDKLSSDGNFKRPNLNLFDQDDDQIARGIVGGMDFDEELEDSDDDDDDDDNWDEADDFFKSK